ncbi:NAD-glutamate dehydrogenase [Aliiruegeria lutimaris]|uniref:Glutamate dehydrogenase (NAD) n=1 Tax=Aliiruegeria lutimaris TaxID=571298 RepID=A0A1G9LSP1_9RHOB|nr:NAD-glutamate dehydrogenase [Aliiruegeria lutimaris]SDL65010.1 glutamate dehydrogenase (NAD) [Aliiruegeria lutimaris]
MTMTDEEMFSEKLQEVREIAAERLDGADRESFLEAIDLLLSRSSPEDVKGRAAHEIYGSALALWKFAARREAGTVRVRLYNPRMSEHGWECSHSVLEIVNDDMPFIVDSLTSFLTVNGLTIHSLIHPLITVRRNAAGERVDVIPPGGEGGKRESMIQVQIDQIGDEETLDRYEAEILQVLADVRVAVGDWKPILTRLVDVTDSLKRAPAKGTGNVAEDVVEFLEWLAQNHFTFLGYREYENTADAPSLQQVKGSALGLMRDPEFTVLRDLHGNYADWSPEMDAFITDVSPLMIIKANRRSTVHRSTHFDLIGVKKFDRKGAVTGVHLFVGHFTAAAYNRSPRSIPLLRQKVERLVERSGFAPESHDAKALAHVLGTYPRDELFQSSDNQLFENAMGVLHLAIRPRTRLFVRPDRFGRFVSCLVFVPRERYNTELRQRVGDILAEEFDGRVATWTPSFGDEVLARVHYVIALEGTVASNYDTAAIETRILDAVRDWSDHLRDALIERKGESEGNRLHALYGAGFGASYRDEFSALTAISDIEKMEGLNGDSGLELKFYRRLEDPESKARFKLYRLGRSVPLSDCLPILENMGFRIQEEHPFWVERGNEVIWIHDFHMQSAKGGEVDLSELRTKLEEAFATLWTGKVDDDPLNRLVLVAGLSVRETALLRAYSGYLRQARIPYSMPYMQDALIENPHIACKLVDLFYALFDPVAFADGDKRLAGAEKIVADIEAALEEVASLDFDRILRRFRNAIQATLRTNYFQSDAAGQIKPYMSFKFDCSKLEDLPLPHPWREIFVYSTLVEGVHLRYGPVARGGLRWSDRKEDYRTEVLGLVKAQQVKNAVIVPVGSKGGFLPKTLPVDGTRDEVVAEAVRCYRIFLSGLLDLTDNIVGPDVVPPESVIRHDTDDPYLVVAADKGTATFSDYANALATEYGFWLGDAFASGGSNGYDHKGMGITARGAWEAVKRHFRELGHDTQTEPFTVIGCGDMSGDVFGNGMLLSDQIRLVAAFDHRDIFIDPNPDPAASFAERKRLFELPRSSWRSYDSKLISNGGGVFSRSAKSIALTPEIKALTGLSAARVTPYELIKALLKAKTDLLWFGGIGTYIKSTTETHADTGDKANDNVRVDATEIRARVIGEGANLGVSQRGRVQLAKAGVKLNNDAVDNSAGVDCSDHEVNIKVALGAVVDAGDMTEKQRNKLLASMTDEVGELVLKTNYHQTLAISLDEAAAPSLLDEHERFIQSLEAQGKLDRNVEYLPSEEELAERRMAGLGLTRPEISVLVAYAKIDIFSDLVQSEVLDDPYMERFLIEYMPTPLRKKYGDTLRAHRLRREIIATVIANMLVNEGGPTMASRLQEDAGVSIGDIVKAFIIVREVFGLTDVAAEVNALDNKIAASVQIEIHRALSDMLAAQCLRLLKDDCQAIGEAIDRYRPGIAEIASIAETAVSAFSRERLASRTAELIEQGAPEHLAKRVALSELLGGAIDIFDVAGKKGRDVRDVAASYFAAGARFSLDWLRSSARQVEVSDHWERMAVARLMADMRVHQTNIAAAALSIEYAEPGEDSIAKWIEQNSHLTHRADKLIQELRSGGPLTVSKLAVASSHLTMTAN